jgi:hypothetical protein
MPDLNPYRSPGAEPSGSDLAGGPAAGVPGVPGTFEVCFEMTPDDHLAFNIYHFRHSPARRWALLRAWVALPVTAASMLLLLVSTRAVPWQTLQRFWPLIVVFGAFLAAYPLLLPRAVARTVRRQMAAGKNRGVFGPCRLTISPAGVKQVTPLREIYVRWPAVEKIVEGDRHAFLYLSAVGAFVVPKAAFAGEADYLAFLHAARESASRAATSHETR